MKLNREQFEVLALEQTDMLYRVARRMTRDPHRAEDLVQETFLRAFRSIGGFRGQAKFSSWLYRIALNLCRDWLRKLDHGGAERSSEPRIVAFACRVD